MCGIAGILHFDRAEKVDKARLAAMNETIAHRGPDGDGLWSEGPIGLAHRRLAPTRTGMGSRGGGAASRSRPRFAKVVRNPGAGRRHAPPGTTVSVSSNPSDLICRAREPRAVKPECLR